MLLKLEHLDNLAILLDNVCDWHYLADHLGLTEDKKQRIEAGGTVVDPTRPGIRHVRTVDVLRLWREKHRSTVRVLRNVIDTVASDELVAKLDYFRMSKYIA